MFGLESSNSIFDALLVIEHRIQTHDMWLRIEHLFQHGICDVESNTKLTTGYFNTADASNQNLGAWLRSGHQLQMVIVDLELIIAFNN